MASVPEYYELNEDPDFMNVLLMGRHETNVDTLIFANFNVRTRKITLISVPRDLYVNERKINSVYGDYGLYEQVRWVEEVLGYRIHHYALIDMYVFRDIIDEMGGVTVVLEHELSDPSYQSCQSGLCSTVYYPAGEHHLNGTQALQVARSRYTTSDYSRAERQQLILQGLQRKAQDFGFGDADTVMSILALAVDAVDTDISLDEALRYYFRYQSFDLEHGHVLSTFNVLENVQVPVDYTTSLTMENCSDESDPSTCDESYGIYTLQPAGGDWDVIRWWVQQALY